jgi:hypothetical protein
MARYLLPIVLAIGVIGLVVWILDSLASAAKRANQQRLEDKRQREQTKLVDKRRTEEAIRIVGESTPELAALRNAVAVLRDFVARANGYRPKFTLPRDCESSGDGPDPEPWVTTVDNLLVPKAHDLRWIYTKSNSAPPECPRVELSPLDIKIFKTDTLGNFLIWLAKLCTGKA